jgi:hypothetical protein
MICSRDGWKKNQCAFTALREVLGALQKWMHTQTPVTIAGHVQSFFPELSPQQLESALARYLHHSVWAQSPQMSKTGFDRLSYSLHSGGFIRTQIDFASCITPLDTPNISPFTESRI